MERYIKDGTGLGRFFCSRPFCIKSSLRWPSPSPIKYLMLPSGSTVCFPWCNISIASGMLLTLQAERGASMYWHLFNGQRILVLWHVTFTASVRRRAVLIYSWLHLVSLGPNPVYKQSPTQSDGSSCSDLWEPVGWLQAQFSQIRWATFRLTACFLLPPGSSAAGHHTAFWLFWFLCTEKLRQMQWFRLGFNKPQKQPMRQCVKIKAIPLTPV